MIPSIPPNTPIRPPRRIEIEPEPPKQQVEEVPLPPTLKNTVFIPAAKVGAIAGGLGLFFGSAANILYPPKKPVLRATVTGINWFLLAGTYHATRNFTTQRIETDQGPLTPNAKVGVSAFAGWATGNLAGALTGNVRSIISGGIVFAALGAGGQYVYTRLDERKVRILEEEMEQEIAEEKAAEELRRKAKAEGKPEPVIEVGKRKEGGWGDWLFRSKWSPIKSLTLEEYERLMNERILRIDVERGVIMDELVKLREVWEVEKRKEMKEDKEAAGVTAALTSSAGSQQKVEAPKPEELPKETKKKVWW